jgi:hypothetical protein
MAEKPKKAAKKAAAKAPRKIAAKPPQKAVVKEAAAASKVPQKAAVEALAPTAKRPAGVRAADKAEAPKAPRNRTTKAPVPKPAFTLPRFDPKTDWGTAGWISDPALLAQIRATMLPETIGYPERLPDVGRAVLTTFEAAVDLASPLAPLKAGERYALATRRDGTFVLYDWP